MPYQLGEEGTMNNRMICLKPGLEPYDMPPAGWPPEWWKSFCAAAFILKKRRRDQESNLGISIDSGKCMLHVS